MSKPDLPAARIHAVTADLDRELRRRHIVGRDRRAIVDEVRSDLVAAAADGVAPEVLIGGDTGAFADAAIEAAGYQPRPHDLLPVLARSTLGAGVVVVAAYLVIVPVIQPALAAMFTLDGRYPSLGPVVVYGAIALAGLGGTLAVLRSVMAGRPAARETVRRAALLTPVAAAAGIAAAVAVARDPDYAATGTSVTAQVLLVALPVVAALGVSRWWALRATVDHDPAPGSPASV